jgi:O-antigen ligase
MLMTINEKKLIVFAALVSTILFIGGAFPYGFPLFSPLVSILLALHIISNKILFFDKLILFYLLLIIIYILSIGIFGELSPKNIQDIVNGITVLTFFVLFQSTIRNRHQFNRYTKYIQNFIFISSFIIASIGLIKFFFLLQGIEISFFQSSNRKYPLGSTLVNDYNMFGLCLLSGLVSGYYIIKRKKSLHYFVVANLMALTIFFASVFSASRRTWFVLSVFSLVLAGAFLKNLMRNIFLFLRTFKLKQSVFIRNLTLCISLVTIIFAVVAFIPKDISIKHPYQLGRIQYRFNTIKNFSEINSQPFSRYNRYNYAFKLINDYSIFNLIFGKGSDYLQRFGQKFQGSGYDYPHNHILSAILQSGLIGALVVIGYICYCLFIYLKHVKYKETRFYFLIMLISSFYWFLSGNSTFSSKIYIFFALLMPLAIQRIFKKKYESGN